MISIFLILVDRLCSAIATFPDLASLPSLMIIVFLYALFTLTLGWRSGFLRWKYQSDKLVIIRVVITSLIAPAILEELFFRVVLLPYPSNQVPLIDYLAWAGLSLSLFVIYHPINALTFFPQGKKAFFNPFFLTLAAALGITCTIAYWPTGSLWIPVLIHWLAVVLWLLCFGGLEKLAIS